MSEQPTARLRYRDLPSGNARGVFGDDDWLGCLNLLTPERTLAAAQLVRAGIVVSLNASLIAWNNPGFFGNSDRPAPTHTVLWRDRHADDVISDWNPQSSSQWDHFMHFGDHATGTYYNGHSDTSVGIDLWAERGIVGRGVLLDVAGWASRAGRPLDWRRRDVITVADLDACAEDAGVSVTEGTILLVRTGWESGYAALGQSERDKLPLSEPATPGLEASEEMAAWLWDHGVAAVASDNPALEAWPMHLDGYVLHTPLLSRLGIPIGEFWLLDRLATHCRDLDQFEFLLTSAPLNVPGGVSSPPNALAIL